MGAYLRSKIAYTLYKSETEKSYFVDKSSLLSELFPLVKSGNNHICITRPRRFGKTVMANMVAAFFSDACDAADVFDGLDIAGNKEYKEYRNQFPVIHLSLGDIAEEEQSYGAYKNRLASRLIRDLKAVYPDVETGRGSAVADALVDIYVQDDNARFIFVLDEWDFIFHQDFVTEDDKKDYLVFLRNLLKDRPYVRLVYMTGILPVAKYSSGSELNMFTEYTMVNEERFSRFFGFTDKEVDMLFGRYREKEKEKAKLTREGLQKWYDGYQICSGERVYNPRSVVLALTNNNLGNYWSSSGPYDEIFYYIENNVAEVREDLALMAAGGLSGKIRREKGMWTSFFIRKRPMRRESYWN